MNELKAFDLLSRLWHDTISLFPSLLGAAGVFLVGWILAKIISIGLRRILEKIKVDKISEKLNEIDFISKSNFEIKFSVVIAKIVYFIIMLITIMVATEILNISVLTELLQNLFNYLPNILVACIIMIIGLIISEYIRKIIRTTATTLGIPAANLIASFVFYFLIINVLISALTQAQIKTEFISQNLSLIIGGFVLAFAIGYGLASKSTVSNYLASFYTKNQIGVGDTIKINDRIGTVIHMTKSALILHTTEKTELIIPLSQISNSMVEILREVKEETDDEH